MRPNFLEGASMYASRIAERLVGEEMLARRIKRPEARRIVAREAGIAAGSLESLARGRLKFIDRIADKLNALLVRKIEQRIASLEEELAIAKAIGGASEVIWNERKWRSKRRGKPSVNSGVPSVHVTIRGL
jgi:hypothetical protein